MFHMKLSLVLSLVVASSALAQSPRTLKPEDFAQLREVDEPNLSPDGNFIAYVVKVADMEKDKRPGNLWLAKWDGSENRALTFGNKAQKHPRWSPDGKWIGFLSGREDENEIDQLFFKKDIDGYLTQRYSHLQLLDLTSRKIEPLTSGAHNDFLPAWSPDG